MTPTVAGGTGLMVDGVSVDFGGVAALRDVAFSVQPGQICGLIGPNGAGKTTFFNCVSRFVEPRHGSISWNGADLLSLSSHQVVQTGVVRTFQNLGLVPELTVLQNVQLGAFPRADAGFLRGAAGRLLPAVRTAEARVRAESSELLEQLDLVEVATTACADLPFGTLKRVELARALMTRPSLLLLDEPASGLTHGEVAELSALLAVIRERADLTLVLVEHHMGLVMGLCDTVVVFDSGQVIAAGLPSEVRENPAVISAYLGGAA